MSNEAPPPQLPPQMSPDGKWIWDGAQWRPIPVHEAAFPNWKGAGAGFVPGVDTQSPAVAVATPRGQRSASPPAAYRMAGPAPGLAVPRWSADSARASIERYLPMAIGAAGLIVVIVLVSVVATLFLSNRQDDTASGANTQLAGGPTTRSDSALSAYILKSLETPMSDLTDNVTLLTQTCRPGMTSACEDAAINIANTISPVLTLLKKTAVPACIATPAAALRGDLTNMDDGQKMMLKAFSDQKRSEFTLAYSELTWYGAHSGTDYAATKSAAGYCDSALTGP